MGNHQGRDGCTEELSYPCVDLSLAYAPVWPGVGVGHGRDGATAIQTMFIFVMARTKTWQPMTTLAERRSCREVVRPLLRQFAAFSRTGLNAGRRPRRGLLACARASSLTSRGASERRGGRVAWTDERT